MKRLRVFVALGSSLCVGACQTVSAAATALPPAGPSPVAAASATPVSGSLRASRAGVSRPAVQTDAAAPTSNFAGANTRTLVIVLAVAAVVVIGVLLMSGDDGGVY